MANSAGEGVGVVSLVSVAVALVVANSAGEGDGVAPRVSVGVAVSSDVEGEGDFNESDG